VLFHASVESWTIKDSAIRSTSQVLTLELPYPTVARENARIATRSPSIAQARSCQRLSEVDTKERFDAVDSNTLGRIISSCPTAQASEPNRLRYQRPLLDELQDDLRIDYEYPAHTGNLFEWESTSPILQARGNYVEIGKVAEGQTWMFFAGVLVGLAGGLLPIVIETVAKNMRWIS
jgi:hypothetical protein